MLVSGSFLIIKNISYYTFYKYILHRLPKDASCPLTILTFKCWLFQRFFRGFWNFVWQFFLNFTIHCQNFKTFSARERLVFHLQDFKLKLFFFLLTMGGEGGGLTTVTFITVQCNFSIYMSARAVFPWFRFILNIYNHIIILLVWYILSIQLYIPGLRLSI